MKCPSLLKYPSFACEFQLSFAGIFANLTNISSLFEEKEARKNFDHNVTNEEGNTHLRKLNS